jgi:hypothetical protein
MYMGSVYVCMGVSMCMGEECLSLRVKSLCMCIVYVYG